MALGLPFCISQLFHFSGSNSAVGLAPCIEQQNELHPGSCIDLVQIIIQVKSIAKTQNAYLEQGRYEEAVAAHENLSHLPFWAFALGQTYAWAGQPEKALEIALGYEHKPPFAIPLTIIYAALGDVEQTVYWMEQSRNHSLPWRMAMPGWFTAVRSLHEDPRIQAEAEKLGMPLIPYPKS